MSHHAASAPSSTPTTAPMTTTRPTAESNIACASASERPVCIASRITWSALKRSTAMTITAATTSAIRTNSATRRMRSVITGWAAVPTPRPGTDSPRFARYR